MKYLYFCTDETLASILKSKEIRKHEKNVKHVEKEYKTYNSKKQKIIAFVYNIEMISKSKCYISFPYDYLGKTETKMWRLLFGFLPIRFKMLSHILPKNGRAITFNIVNEDTIEHFYLYDKYIDGKMYCESVSTKPIKIENISEIQLTEAFEIIGLRPPYLSFPFQNFMHGEPKILISPDYKIGH